MLHLMSSPHIRSFIIKSNLHLARDLDLEWGKMKLLRVLDLSFTGLKDLGEQIGNLILLRYLRINACYDLTNILLESIKKLRNLLILMYIDNVGATIPNNMVGSMENLIILFLGTSKIEGPVLGVKRSRSLQCLSAQAGEWLTKELHVNSMIDSLRVLRLEKIESQAQLEAIYKFVNNSNPSNHLHTLDLALEESSGLKFDLERMKLKDHRLLKSFILWGQIGNHTDSEPLSFPRNLLNLYLGNTKIEKEEHLKGALNQLHQLRHLTLCDAYKGDELTISGLPQLQGLSLYNLVKLKEWRIEEGSLGQLNNLYINSCNQLERIPEGISSIDTLQHFTARDMSESFCEKLRRPSEKEEGGIGAAGGEHFHLIRHIPNIKISDRNRRRYA